MVIGHTSNIYVLRHPTATKANIAALPVMWINRVQHKLRDLSMPTTNMLGLVKKQPLLKILTSLERTHISPSKLHKGAQSPKKYGNGIKLADLMYDFQKSGSIL